MKTISTVLLALLSAVSGARLLAGDWPQLLGPDRDGKYHGGTIRTDWGGERPPILWSLDLGEGFAGPIAVEGVVFIAHREGNENVLDAIRVAGGSRVWRASHGTVKLRC